ncbi:MAG: tripartite tricarboxylate transporter substrate binding protein [Lawsonibacter sp.]
MKENIKRFYALLLALVMLLALASCSKPSQPATSAPAASGSAASSEPTGWTPTEPVHIVGQSEAGSGPDLFVRALQPWLQQELGIAVVVENAPGSGGKIASTQVWKADPDGYTLLAHSSPLTTVTQISKDCEYNIPDFKHIISFDSTPYAVIVKKGSKIDSIEKLIELSKTEKLANSNSGIGGAMYLQSMIMKNTLGIDYDEVPYNGTNPAILAIMNGDVTMSVAAYDSAINNQDELTILAVLSDERIEQLPDVPCMKELGYEFPFLTMRRGIIAPPNTPQEVVDRLIDAFSTAVENPEFQNYVKTSGINLDVVVGDDYQAIDQDYYATILKYIDYLGE